MFFLRKLLIPVLLTILQSSTGLWASNNELFEEPLDLEKSYKSLFGADLKQKLSHLEQDYPHHFGGFSKLHKDLPLIKLYKKKESLYSPDKSLSSSFGDLEKALKEQDNPKFQPLLEDLADVIKNPEKQTLFLYMCSLIRAPLLSSQKTDLEEQFFKLEGFSSPYLLIGVLNPSASLDEILKKMEDFQDDKGDHISNVPSNFFDKESHLEKTLDKSPYYNSIPYLMLCQKPKEGILGYFYLAYTYYAGLYTVPVSLASEKINLHGVPMSAWGQVAHDCAHAVIAGIYNNTEQFLNPIGDSYLEELTKHLKVLNSEEKKKYGMKQMIAPLSEFSTSIYNAYQQSLLEILLYGLKTLGVSKDKTLSPEIEIFSVAAFMHAHETLTTPSLYFANKSLGDILENSINPFITSISRFESASQKKDKEEDDKGRGNSSTSSEEDLFKSEEDLFKTSFVTGESSLTDEEIFDIVKKRPLKEFLSYSENLVISIEEDKISEWVVTRNTLYIEVIITLIDGKDYTYRARTNFSKTLNLEHDRAFELPAQSVLEKKYNFKVPEVPSWEQFKKNTENKDTTEGYGLAFKECSQQLLLGRRFLLEYFLETSKRLIKIPLGEKGRTIEDRFSMRYEAALKRLEGALPPFIKDRQDVQAFLVKASEGSKH